MKAHYNRISKAQYKAIHDEMRKQQAGITRRIIKLFCIALNESYGFGKKRSRDILLKVMELADKHLDDEVFWYHADKRIRQLGFSEKELLNEDYKEMEK